MSIQTGTAAAAIAVAALLGGCSQWQAMDQTSGAAAGAASGAVAGAVVGGPVGAVIGGVGGAYVGYGTTGYGATAPAGEQAVTAKSASSYSPSTVRAVQQALNDRGYNAGPVDGQWGATTQEAVKRFQRASGLPETGELAPSTLSALGVS